MSSPLTPKLGTNYSPTDEEVAEIKSLLIEPSLRLKSLNDEIADLQRAIDKLEEQRDALGAYIEAHTALISPLRRMPPDIIQEIFMACLPTHRNCVMSAKEAPVLLGRICSSWRTLSLSTPRLWSRLHMVEPTLVHPDASKAVEEKLVQRLETTKTWLDRSGQCTLSISFGSSFSGFRPNTQDSFMKVILPFASRWEHITFAIPPLLLLTTSRLTEADLSNLKSLAIHQTDVEDTSLVRWDSLSLLRAPNLSRVSISSARLNPLTLPLQWNQLTHLSITDSWDNPGLPVTSETILQVLDRCPQLRVCKMCVEDYLNGLTKQLGPILELSGLHTFDLQCFGDLPSTIHKLLNRIFLPDLRHLTFSGHCSIGDIPPYPPLRVVAPRLEFLNIDRAGFPESSLQALFTGLPHTLRRLRLWDFVHVWQGETEISTEDHDLLALLPPVLHELQIRDCESVSDSQILSFISSRTNVGKSSLRSVTINFSRQIQVDILPELQQLMEAGLHIELRYPPAPLVNFSPWEGLEEGKVFGEQ
ncbi:hypothetical protein B0H11DRAFT_1989391 [Mycena galericulata]|nr:hypothetical protein B0H11DRAFT_1989391 [Mycena galericulata]